MVDVIRRCVFRPYARGRGPFFTLKVWDSGKLDGRGQTYLGYELRMHEKAGAKPVELFKGEDFAGSPMHAIDSDATMASLMGFLTLRPGDTDSDYFSTYTTTQLDYCNNHAEYLSCDVENRFGSH